MDTSAAEQSARMNGAGDISSPEFEFWMVGKNPSVPQPDLLTADELFVDGVLLPLHQLAISNSNTSPAPEPLPAEASDENAPPLQPSTPAVAAADPDPSSSSNLNAKKWKDLFKMGEKALEELRERRKQRRDSVVAGGAVAPELNIHIWPFSRSRSAGNAGAGTWQSRARAVMVGRRKVSSAPCSRSNSRGESSKPAAATAGHKAASSFRKWTTNPVRLGHAGGIHLGRANPVWKLRRKINQAADPKEKQPSAAAAAATATATGGAGAGARRAAVGSGGNAGVRVLNFNVNTCIGYRNQASCRDDHAKRMPEAVAAAASAGDGQVDGESSTSTGSINGSLFNLRTIFSKKVY